MDEDPTTQELRIAQVRREAHERERAGRPEEEPEQHDRRADKAAYLREKLEERAAAEREADAKDSRGRPD